MSNPFGEVTQIEDLTVQQSIDMGRCPNCHSPGLKASSEYMSCSKCGLHGNPAFIKFCEKVPIFNVSDGSNLNGKQLYEDGFGKLFVLEGHAQGCGRVLQDDWCNTCRTFMPKPSSGNQRSAVKPARSRAYSSKTNP